MSILGSERENVDGVYRVELCVVYDPPRIPLLPRIPEVSREVDVSDLERAT
jgi:hypothetical protein